MVSKMKIHQSIHTDFYFKNLIISKISIGIFSKIGTKLVGKRNDPLQIDRLKSTSLKLNLKWI